MLPGTHNVHVTKKGYRAFGKVVEVKAGETVKVAVSLEPLVSAGRVKLDEPKLAGAKVFVDGARQSACQTINRAVRSRVLRGDFREKAYGEMIDQLVTKMRPPIEQLAESQFREGIVLSEEGVHRAMKEFRVKAIVLLRRDMEKWKIEIMDVVREAKLPSAPTGQGDCRPPRGRRRTVDDWEPPEGQDEPGGP